MMPFPKNPFRPGAGLPPAHKGSRPETETILLQLLRRLRDGDHGGEMAFLYGPRGNGKTVLLHWLENEASAATIATVALVPEHLDSPAGLARAVRSATRRFPKLTEWASMLEADVGGVRFRSKGDDPIPLLADLLDLGEDGVLLMLDEAHEAPPDMLGRLLNAAQLAGRNRPVAAVLAGTPGLEATLHAAHASFWSRGRTLPIGLLGETSAIEALARPFQNAGIEADERAVEELVRAADNYPYFLQLYGEAAWNVVEASGGRAFLPEHVAPTFAAADRARRHYYRHRYREFGAAGLLPVARRVAAAFVASAETSADRRLTDVALDALLAYEGGYDHKEFLIAKGYVWQDGSGDPSWTPGIPSLMDYMLECIPAA